MSLGLANFERGFEWVYSWGWANNQETRKQYINRRCNMTIRGYGILSLGDDTINMRR